MPHVAERHDRRIHLGDHLIDDLTVAQCDQPIAIGGSAHVVRDQNDRAVLLFGGESEQLERLAKDFRVLSEVGSKDSTVVVAPYRWVKQIKEELAAGAWKVVTEGRESGTVGLYRSSGEIRTGLIEEIEVQIDTSNLIFEGPQKAQQVWLVKHFGCNVNLGNIAPSEVISLETIRQGLRADTMLNGKKTTPTPQIE